MCEYAGAVRYAELRKEHEYYGKCVSILPERETGNNTVIARNTRAQDFNNEAVGLKVKLGDGFDSSAA